ncbi:PadR family transcriptional regulator [Amycolatopsis benzoatilytica]|uniref:PadR family transcriptional regulator n=1 Tax=Amycolatopsis benzoatilytica TaxID=346045 RepID=UPI00037BFE99|nr:PadR family transcriptional regulator [Amycolatopsis benzoatilytica]
MKRRKVASMLGLAVLTTLYERPMHPYEAASVMRSRGKEGDFKIKWGSLYTVVANLEKHGFIEAVENVRDGSRPERTVYRITDSGRAEVRDWVAELLGVPDAEPNRFHMGLSVMAVLGPDGVHQRLGARLDTLVRLIEERVAALAEMRGEVPRLMLVESEYELAMWRAEADWVRALREDLGSGAMPGLEEWRHFAETGEVPGISAFVEPEGG